MKENRLVSLRKRLDRVKATLSSLEGERKALLARLEREYGAHSTEQVEKKIEELEASIKKKEKRKEVLLAKVEKGLSEVEQRLRILETEEV